MELQLSWMVEAEKILDVILVPNDDDGDDRPDPGPQNPEEAKAYTDKIVNAFDTFWRPNTSR